MRPGYGYHGSSDPNFDVLAPANTGIWMVDPEGGEPELLVSLAEIAAIPWPGGDLSQAKHYFSVLLCNPNGTRFLFLHRWRFPARGFQTRLVTCAMEGTDIRVVDDSGHTSHLIWKDDKTILAWSRPYGQPAGFWLFPDGGGKPEPIGQDRMPPRRARSGYRICTCTMSRPGCSMTLGSLQPPLALTANYGAICIPAAVGTVTRW